MYSLLNSKLNKYNYILIIHDKYKICVINMYINTNNKSWK